MNQVSADPAALLLVGGLDSSGGAGLTLDLRVAKFFGVSAYPIVTCLAFQSDRQFHHLTLLPMEWFSWPEKIILSPTIPRVLKSGAFGSLKILGWFLRCLKDSANPLIVDPVLFSSSKGHLFKEADTKKIRKRFCEELGPRATLLTPNLPEARFLLGAKHSSPERLALALEDRCHCAILLKGGHGENSSASTDFFCQRGEIKTFSHPRHPRKVRGTGCALATAIASLLTKGKPLEEAIEKSIRQVNFWIQTAREITPGHFHLSPK